MDSAFGMFMWAACMLGGMVIGGPKDRLLACFALAVLLGPVGVMIAAFLPPRAKPEGLVDDQVAGFAKSGSGLHP